MKNERQINICIAGKNNIAVMVAQYILGNYSNVVLSAIFNQNDDGKNGFQRSFKQFCRLHNIQETSLDSVYAEPDMIFLSLEFDKIVKPQLFASRRLYNIHFSFLPEYKGMYTSALPILHGKSYTGVTFHEIDKGIDTGAVIDQEKILISDVLTAEKLYEKYIEKGADVVIRNLSSVIEEKCVAVAQTSHQSSYYSAKTIDYKNLIIDLRLTAFQMQRQVNAFVFPSYQLPVVHDYKIYKCDVTTLASPKSAGKVINDTKFYLEINTIDYNVILHKDLRDELWDMARTGSIDNLKQFIECGYDLLQRSVEGWDIAIIAAYNDQFGFLEYLLKELNWDVNTYNYNGTTLAMYLMTRASKSDELDFFRTFLDQYKLKLNLNRHDYFGRDIYSYATEYGNENVINLLKTYNQND